jgi:glutathione S-transferase
MTIQLTAFAWVPDFAQGYVRDLRVRWALEEAGLAHEVVLVDGAALGTAAHLRWQPFAQVPAYRDEAVEMFESGAIVLHVAEKSAVLAPRDAAGRARVASWVVAALNSVEPQVQNVAHLDAFHAGEAWVEGYRPQAAAFLQRRLARVAAWLDGRDYLEGRFTAGDLVMATVLREASACGALAPFPVLEAYLARCLARPAFRRALEAQLQTFRAHAPAA